MTTDKNPPRKNIAKGTRSAGSNQLDSMHLGRSESIVPKGFKPWVARGITTEKELLDNLRNSMLLGDSRAETILQLMPAYTINELIVENIIIIEPI